MFNQCDCDSHESASAVIRPHSMAPSVDPVCLGCRQFGCKCYPDLLINNTGHQWHHDRAFHQKRQQVFPPSFNEPALTSLASQMAWSQWNTQRLDRSCS
ncbi:hypothetical protein TNCV_2031161 [Trichonephila clavipes]|nr:hypothetical protein TNCV_2031161 [Trichonephila clavipes]